MSERIRELHRIGVIDAREAAQPGLAQQREMDREGEYAQPRICADIRGRLLAADVLLPRLQRQDVSRLPIDVGGLAHDAARHPADVLHPGRDDPEVGTPIVEMVPQDLPLGHRDVGTQLSGRRQHPQ